MFYEDEIMEGGNLISTSEPINAGKAREIAEQIISDLEGEFGTSAKIKGSLNTKSDDEECNDIDIALQYEWSPEEVEHLKSFLMSKYNCDTPVTNQGLRVVSFGFRYDTEDGHYKDIQVDICQTKNMGFHMAYHSPSVNSSFKNFVKDTLVRIVVKCTPIEGEEPELFGDEFGDDWKGRVKSRRHYSITSDDNVVIDKSSWLGKKGKPVKKPQVDASAREPFTDDFNVIIKKAFGPDVTMEDLSSTESIIAYLFSGKYPYASKEILDEIKDKMIDHLSDRGTPEEREVLPAQFMEVWNKYAGSEELNEGRYTNMSLRMTNLMRRMQIL